jgi:tRNA-modifying protein YgfZ
MTEETIPLEAGLLERAISTAKGCYVGQEVIIRVLHRGSGRVAKRLVKLTGDAALQAVPPAGTRLISDAREVGRITSAAISPSRQQVVALGYLRRDRAEPGVHVTAHIEGHDHTLTVERLAG